MRVLIAEDEAYLNRILEKVLTKAGYAVDSCADGQEALEYLESTDAYDAAILDIMMPRVDGLTVLRRIRERGSDLPVLLLTARDAVESRVEGLDLGADDYLTKPFATQELLARLRVTWRRLAYMQSAGPAASPVFVNGKLRVDYAAGCAYLDGEELHLTPIEYKLLTVLARNVGKVLTHSYIMERVWGGGGEWENNIASLRVFMATLRKKLEPTPDGPQFIQTHVGVGYRMLRVE